MTSAQRRLAVTIAVILIAAVCVTLVVRRDGDDATVVRSESPPSSIPEQSSSPLASDVPVATSIPLIVGSTTTSRGGGPPASTVPRSGDCPPSRRVEVPCPLRDGEHSPVKASGLPSPSGISFGLCVVTPTPSITDCTPGTEHQTATDFDGNLSTYLTFERFLLIEDTVIDCATIPCELRVRVQTTDGGPASFTLREPLVYSASPTRSIDLGPSETLVHQAPRTIEITGLSDVSSNSQLNIEQCVRWTLVTAFGTPYENCIHVAVTNVERDGGRIRATIAPSRWGYDGPGPLSSGAPTLIDCAAPSRPCYLRAITPGQGGYVRRPLRIVGDGAAAAAMTVSKATGLADFEPVEITMQNMPPRRWAYLFYCLDPQRQEAAPPADGDGLTACVRLLALPDRSDETAWPAPSQQLTINTPRFLEWAGTNHDCADPRGCDLVLMTGSDIYPDFAYHVRVNFAT